MHAFISRTIIIIIIPLSMRQSCAVFVIVNVIVIVIVDSFIKLYCYIVPKSYVPGIVQQMRSVQHNLGIFSNVKYGDVAIEVVKC